MALAYFITFTTYGTWLHGSEKGSVDAAHNTYGEPFLPPDAKRRKKARSEMKQPPYYLGEKERQIVCDAIVSLAEERGWQLLAVHVRTYHVHVVVSYPEGDPGRMMSDMKARASRDLNSAGFDDATRKRWTRHGSTRHLFREDQVPAAVHYTLDEQGDRMAWWSADQEPRTQ